MNGYGLHAEVFFFFQIASTPPPVTNPVL